MKNSKLWFREIMSIKIPNLIHKDLTKILFLFYLIKSKKFNYNYKISDFNSYVYRFYSDNHELAKLHPSIIVNSINHYGTKELLPFTIQMLEEWKKDFPNGCLTYNETHFKVEIEDFSDDVLEFTENIADMLYQKATNMHYTYSEELEELNEISEYKLDLINLTRLKNRVFENIQYCCCCDSCDDLYIINISEDLDKINQISNYITVCKKHYELHKLGYFSFKETGKINIIKIHPDLNPSMRISSVVLKNMKNINLSYGIEAVKNK